MAAWRAASSPWMIVLALNIVFRLVGCFVDSLSAIVVLTPLLIPLVKAAGTEIIGRSAAAKAAPYAYLPLARKHQV